MADDGFAAFFQEAYPRVVGQLRLLIGDRAAAEDVAQEAFTRAATRWRQLSRYDQPEAWVRMTAFRLAIDLPVETVAAQTGVSPGTVKSRLSRGRERLAALLAPEETPAAPEPAPGPEEEERHARP